MMISSHLERNLAISCLCTEILASNEHINSVSSLNKNGKVVESKFRNDRIITNMTKQEHTMLFMHRALQTSLSMEFDDLIGSLDFICLQRKTILELIFPYSEGIILVMCDLTVIPSYMAKKISFILRDFECRMKRSLYA